MRPPRTGLQEAAARARLLAAIGSILLLTVACLSPRVGGFTMTVEGLPEHLQAEIHVTSYDWLGSIIVHVSSSSPASRSHVRIGTYPIEPQLVTDGFDTYVGSGPQWLTVNQNQTTELHYVYRWALPTDTGALELIVEGLPAGTDAAVAITGPGGFDESVVATTSYPEMTIGEYTILPDDVVSGPDTYTASGGTFAVHTDQTVTVTISYNPVPTGATGNLALEVEGLPEELVPSIQITGPDGFHANPTSAMAYTGVPAGEYAISLGAVNQRSGSRDLIHRSDPPGTQVIQLAAGASQSFTASYTLPRVLLFTDLTTATDITALQEGLELEGYQLQVVRGSHASANNALIIGQLDLIVWQLEQYAHRTPDASALDAFLANGGSFVFLSALPDDELAPLHATLETAADPLLVDDDRITLSPSQLATDIGSPLWLAGRVGHPHLSVGLQPVGAAESLCTYVNVPRSCAVLGNEGRTLVLGFVPAAVEEPPAGTQLVRNLSLMLLGY